MRTKEERLAAFAVAAMHRAPLEMKVEPLAKHAAKVALLVEEELRKLYPTGSWDADATVLLHGPKGTEVRK